MGTVLGEAAWGCGLPVVGSVLLGAGWALSLQSAGGYDLLSVSDIEDVEGLKQVAEAAKYHRRDPNQIPHQLWGRRGWGWSSSAILSSGSSPVAPWLLGSSPSHAGHALSPAGLLVLPFLLQATSQLGQDSFRRQHRRAHEAGQPVVPPSLTSSALSPRDFLPEAGEDGAGAACEELPELHCVSQALLASVCHYLHCSVLLLLQHLRSSSRVAVSSIPKIVVGTG